MAVNDNLRRRGFLVVGAAAAVLSTGSRGARGQSKFPTKVIKIVVPYPAGGPVDAIARIVANELGPHLSQNAIVENAAGASGSIGTRTVARSEPDGHTVVFGTNQTHGNNKFLLKEPGYDPIRDFAPLAGVGAFEHVFVARNDLPVRSIQDLIKLAKGEPGKLNYGSTGIGSGSHLATELFMVRTGARMTHLAFRGASPLVLEMVAGRLDVANSTLPSVLAQIQAGQIRALGLASPQRTPSLPGVPTLREQGINDADADSWAAFFAPAATPAPVLARLSGEIVAVLGQPAIREAITKLGFTMNVRDPATFRSYHDQEIKVWEGIIKEANVAKL